MNTQTKNLILIIIFFLFIIGGLFFVYQLFISDNEQGDTVDIATQRRGEGTLFPRSEEVSIQENLTIQQDGSPSRLRQISSVPTSGGVVFNTDENTVIRYIERSTGHIFETTTDSLEQNRISNTTIPRIQESVWSPDGEMVILRYLDQNETIKSFYGKITQSGVLEGFFLSNNITDIAVNEDEKLFYIRKIGNDSEGIISDFDGSNSTTVLSSKIYDWLPLWINGSAALSTKASRGIDGFLYQLRSRTLTKLLSAQGLLTKINIDGTKILFSTSNTNGTRLFVYDTTTKESVRVPFTTLADKCVWASSFSIFCASPYNSIAGVVPDDWYKGLFSFSDDIWFYDIETQTAQLIYNADENRNVFDAINLTIDNEQKMLLFTNKNDLTLWGLSL